MSHTLLFPLESLASSTNGDLTESNTDSIKTGKVIANEEEEIPLYKEAEHIGIDVSEDENASAEEIDSINILIYLKNNDKVAVIEEFESYSFVEFVQPTEVIEELSESNEEDLEEPKVWQGYIDNKHLEIESDDAPGNESNQNEHAIENEDNLDPDKDSNDAEIDHEDVVSEDQKDVDKSPVEEESSEDNSEATENEQEAKESNLDDEVIEENKIDENELTKSSLSQFSTSSFNQRGVAKKTDTYIRMKPSTKEAPLKIVSAGTVLDFRPYSANENWYEVSIDNKTGYIHIKHFDEIVKNQETVRGVTLKSPTNVREKASTKSKVVHTFPKASIIEYKTYTDHWYEVTLDRNKVGYIHKKHVDNSVAQQESLRGVALKSPTNIRTLPSTKSNVLATYSIGSVIRYKTFNDYWYEVVVIIDGKQKTGFVHKKHVENSVSNQDTVRGVALNSPTNVRERASTKSRVLTTFPVGSVIEYNTFSTYWYELSVTVNGIKRTGYIHKKHVENIVPEQQSKFGLALKSPTNVRARASTKSEIIKGFPVDSIIEFKTFSTYWYEVSVEVNGKKKTGYIHKKHLGDPERETFRGVTLREPTNIRTKPSTKSEVLNQYPQGTILEYKFYNKYWNKVTINVNGKKQIGFIHDYHIDNVKNTIYRGIALNKTTYIRTEPSTKSNPLTTVPNGTIIKYHLYNDHWYEAVVTVNGKERTGFIHKKHIEEVKTNQEKIDGFALRSPTNVREFASTDADVISTFPEGAIVKYKTFTTYWHEVTVKVNGIERTGYIHRNHVGTKAEFHKKTSYNYDYKAMVDIQMNGTPKADGAGNVDATRGQVEFYTNPLNFMKGTPEYFQFLVLSKAAGLDAYEVNEKLLNGKGVLQGMGQAFVDAGKRYNINEVYLIAHALHETGNGNSTLAKGVPVDKNGKVTRNSKGEIAETSKTEHIVYNMFGYGAYDSCPVECGAKHAFDQGWFDLPTSIVGGAGNIVNYINRGQDTLYKMKWNPVSPGYPQYATHVQWAVIQTANIYKIYSSLNSYNVEFDVPTFNNLPNYSKGTYGSTTADKLNFRSGPGTNHDSIGTIPKGSEVQIIGSNPNAWYNVKYNGKTGWISAQYVNLKY